jgi:hypothetical protein
MFKLTFLCFPEKKIPAVFSPNIGSFFVFFSGNFLIFQEISEIFQETSWRNSSRYYIGFTGIFPVEKKQKNNNILLPSGNFREQNF